MTKKTRIEKDSLGEVEVPESALYGAQTQRAINNFNISGQAMPETFIRALLLIKASSARANAELEQISKPVAKVIVQSVDELLLSPDIMTHFPVDVFQTGSGTSTNMNANEVLASIATAHLQRDYPNEKINANDHINYGQSSNDVIPTAIHVSLAQELHHKLLPELKYLQKAILLKAQTLDKYVKTGRTHLMDAMPVKLSQSLNAWASQIEMSIERLQLLQPQLQTLALGGTAVGTGINAHPEFASVFNRFLSEHTGISFKPADNFFTHIGSQDIVVAISGQLKACATSIIKIANDLRWMNSGPLAGLGEISLEALQPGSSIMPGKVNPVIPEAAAMVAVQVVGNDTSITMAGQSGNFELNVMLPLIANNVLSSTKLLANIAPLLADKAISTFSVNEDKLTEALSRNPILITALNSVIGYSEAAKIAKQAYLEGRPILDVAAENTTLPYEELKQLLDPVKLAEGGL